MFFPGNTVSPVCDQEVVNVGNLPSQVVQPGVEYMLYNVAQRVFVILPEGDAEQALNARLVDMVLGAYGMRVQGRAEVPPASDADAEEEMEDALRLMNQTMPEGGEACLAQEKALLGTKAELSKHFQFLVHRFCPFCQ